MPFSTIFPSASNREKRIWRHSSLCFSLYLYSCFFFTSPLQSPSLFLHPLILLSFLSYRKGTFHGGVWSCISLTTSSHRTVLPPNLGLPNAVIDYAPFCSRFPKPRTTSLFSYLLSSLISGFERCPSSTICFRNLFPTDSLRLSSPVGYSFRCLFPFFLHFRARDLLHPRSGRVPLFGEECDSLPQCRLILLFAPDFSFFLSLELNPSSFKLFPLMIFPVKRRIFSPPLTASDRISSSLCPLIASHFETAFALESGFFIDLISPFAALPTFSLNSLLPLFFFLCDQDPGLPESFLLRLVPFRFLVCGSISPDGVLFPFSRFANRSSFPLPTKDGFFPGSPPLNSPLPAYVAFFFPGIVI